MTSALTGKCTENRKDEVDRDQRLFEIASLANPDSTSLFVFAKAVRTTSAANVSRPHMLLGYVCHDLEPASASSEALIGASKRHAHPIRLAFSRSQFSDHLGSAIIQLGGLRDRVLPSSRCWTKLESSFCYLFSEGSINYHLVECRSESSHSLVWDAGRKNKGATYIHVGRHETCHGFLFGGSREIKRERYAWKITVLYAPKLHKRNKKSLIEPLLAKKFSKMVQLSIRPDFVFSLSR